MAGSILKKLKADLQKHDLLRNQSGRKKRQTAEAKSQKGRSREILASIREAYNPFDVKTNREKHGILGSTVIGQTGKPGISKQIGERERKQTYEAQRQLKNHVGGLSDRRFGENDSSLSTEEKMVMRYARERMSRTQKAAAFNLEDDTETLTHFGQSLSMADDFAEDDLGLSDDAGELASGSKRPLSIGSGEVLESDRKKSKHEVMQEVIAKSKMHKAARQQAKEDQEDVVDRLNDQEAFDELLADLETFDRNAAPRRVANEKDDAYDQNVREMIYDKRAKPEDRTKTDEEIAKAKADQESERLRSRQRRMEGDDLDVDDVSDADNDANLFGLDGASADESEDPAAYAGDQDSIPEDDAQIVDEATLGAPAKTADQFRHNLSKIDGQRMRNAQQLRDSLYARLCDAAVRSSSVEEFNKFVQLLKENSENGAEVYGSTIRQMIDSMHKDVRELKNLSTSHLLAFTAIGALFSTSDQWHLVANGATLVAAQYLSNSVDASPGTLSRGLYLCDVLLFYQRLSKRYIPEISSFLLRILADATMDASDAHYIRQLSGPIKLSSKFSKSKPAVQRLGELQRIKIDQVVLKAALTAGEAASLWRGSEAFVDIFSPFSAALDALPNNSTLTEVKDKLDKLLKFARAERKSLQLQDIRPVGIITRAPLFEENYNPDIKNADMDPERREVRKLKAQLKKERKQTLKEIRRDSEFVARQQLTEKRESAKEYHQMVARITDQINNEEGAERNRYEREKNARKRRR